MEKYNQFQFPSPPGSKGAPQWVGDGFLIDEQHMSVLSYQTEPSGWTDDLTSFHEENAGSHHFIDIASRRRAVEQLQKFLHPGSLAPVIIDIGCSSGFLLDEITNQFSSSLIIGSDIVQKPLENLARRKPKIPLLHFDLVTCPLWDHTVDAVVLLNVLEHIEHDERALQQVLRILKPGGIAVIEVPAGPELFDVYDQLLMHHRRYSMTELETKVRRSGFQVLNKSHLGFFIYPPFYFVKKQNKRKRAETQETLDRIVSKDIQGTKENPLLKMAIALELAMGKVISYPFGIRCLITIQKPAG